ncbi:uncharacterized protein BT62DRAFT_915773 [Guyanagaster necrorhizus]|uniref:SET domain-containing protein n=1 Tax=Guyanagaster necrorhizus TaxID=856835 RepID=A0A9P7W679_9AGAR|nr:uncharacterized protein BT62DRAFT_915773 [Guyanagaster necrorhizus MCA 3950]KAG7452006.1 hypothetical protein BT62DRAFT_915773 [Guyanagaster necrorhizus MCA 3950]
MSQHRSTDNLSNSSGAETKQRPSKRSKLKKRRRNDEDTTAFSEKHWGVCSHNRLSAAYDYNYNVRQGNQRFVCVRTRNSNLVLRRQTRLHLMNDRLDPALSVYKQVFDEFYAWEQADTRTYIQYLAANAESDDGEEWDDDFFKFDDHLPSVMDEGDDNDDCGFLVQSFDPDGSIRDRRKVPCVEIQARIPLEFQHPLKYEMCTPDSKNAGQSTSFNSDEVLSFIPYADDEAFPLEEFLNPENLKPFRNFAWQTEDFKDPDVDVIELEVARRLHYGDLGLPLSTIDTLGILHDKVGVPGPSGLLWEASQRDIPFWPGSALTNLPTLSLENLPEKDDIYHDINISSARFCSHINCLVMNCKVHSHSNLSYIDEVLPLDVSKPILTKAGFKLKDGEPCSELCFRSFDETQDGIMEGVHWHDPDDVNFLESVLKVDADMSPCALAVICRKPCLEYPRTGKKVFIYRTRMFPDEKILKGQIIEERRRQPAALVLRQAGNAIQTWAKHRNKCQNVRIQRNQIQNIKVQPTKPAKYGLGAFATRELRAWTYIGEYVGEMRNLSSEESSQRSNILNKYTGLNYNFELNLSLTLDAARRGNETRYLNHSDKPNCEVLVKNVNDEHRIGIFTCENVNKGEELFLDYGPRYWQQYGNSAPELGEENRQDEEHGEDVSGEDDLEYI